MLQDLLFLALRLLSSARKRVCLGSFVVNEETNTRYDNDVTNSSTCLMLRRGQQQEGEAKAKRGGGGSITQEIQEARNRCCFRFDRSDSDDRCSRDSIEASRYGAVERRSFYGQWRTTREGRYLGMCGHGQVSVLDLHFLESILTNKGTCFSFSTLVDVQIVWTFNNTVLTSDGVKYAIEEFNRRLTIRNPQPFQDSGTYTCEVRSGHVSASKAEAVVSVYGKWILDMDTLCWGGPKPGPG